MAKIDDLAKGVSKFTQNLRTKLLSTQAVDGLSEAYAREAAQTIKERTRRGYGLDRDGANLGRLAKLSPMYIERRRAMNLSPETSPGMSNLTQEGHLLDSFTAKRRRPGLWYVALPGNHPNAKIPNATLARYLSRKRPFLYLSASEIQKLGRSHAQRFSNLVNRL